MMCMGDILPIDGRSRGGDGGRKGESGEMGGAR